MKPSWETKNISGIAQKLSLLLNIKNLEIKSLVKPLLQYANINKEENLRQSWVINTLILENNQPLEVLRLKDGTYEKDKVFFYAENSALIHDLFLHGISNQYYKLVRTGSYPDFLYHLIYKSPQLNIETVIFESIEEAHCLEKLKQALERFISLNQLCEGFHLVEHILLRPLEAVIYSLYFYDISSLHYSLHL